MVNGQRIDAEAHLKLRVLVKVVDDDLGRPSRLSSITSRVCSSDSLRIAEISVMTFSLTRLAICCSSAARLTLNGISVMTSCSRLPFISSTPTRPRDLTLPLPVVK